MENVKQNCWETKRCGREEGGARTHELGVCPAAVETRLTGIHGGKNAGRACWVIAGTYCQEKPQGTYVAKIDDCLQCTFYKEVFDQEGKDFVFVRQLISKLQ